MTLTLQYLFRIAMSSAFVLNVCSFEHFELLIEFFGFYKDDDSTGTTTVAASSVTAATAPAAVNPSTASAAAVTIAPKG